MRRCRWSPFAHRARGLQGSSRDLVSEGRSRKQPSEQDQVKALEGGTMWKPATLWWLLLLVSLSCAIALSFNGRAAAASSCSDYVDAYEGSLDVNTSPVEMVASPEATPSPDSLKLARDAYNVGLKSYKNLCDSVKPFADAMQTAFLAWIQHYSGNPSADETTELAAQKLTKCAAHYFGTSKGAKCALWQKKVIHWQSTWSSSQ